MLLFPDLDGNWWEMYSITGNTSDTITVKGPIGIAGRSTSFAITYRMMISQQVPYEPYRWYLSGGNVRFFSPTGPNSFADGDTTYDGICEVCHTQTNHHRNDGSAPAQSHFNGARCTTCHPHSAGFKATSINHLLAGVVVPAAQCTVCHTTTGDPVADVHGNQCGLCHVNPAGAGPLVEPLETMVPHGGDCTACHGTNISQAHPNVDHTATFASAPVTLFETNQHQGAGPGGPFAVLVDCGICHSNNLPAIHGNDCATCHPTPYNTLGSWDGGCQQGGCHFTYHQDASKAHFPLDNGGNCERCHDDATWHVTQSHCLNCHAANTPNDITPPETFCDAQSLYVGPAKISFSIEDDGMVGVGRTFYRLDQGPATAAGKYLSVATSGAHTLEFWSMDQTGNTEEPFKTVEFTIIEDTTPPTSSTNAQEAYNESALITLTATDNSTLGVKNTYFKLNGGPTQTGTSVVAVPATVGTFNYTLDFWSEDWTGNAESQQSVSFTVTVGPPPQVSAPASLTVPTSNTTGSFTVSWGASTTSSVTYVLERSANGGLFIEMYRGTLRSYPSSGLSNGSYVFRVKAVKSGLIESAYTTAGACVVTLPVTSAPATITVPATDTDGAFPVSWTASSTTSVTYKLERSDNGGAFAQVYSGTALTYAVSGLGSGSYVFRVKATKSSYVESTYTTAAACVVTPTAVDAPVALTVPQADTDGAFPVSWPASALTGVTYKLERADNGGAFAPVYSGTALSYAVSGLGNGSYVFRVKATKSGYLDSVYTTSGSCVVTSTAVEAPASISVPATSTATSLTVSWGASPTSDVSYVLERSLNNGTFSPVYSGTALTATVSGMSNGSYLFRVKATKSGYVSSAYVTSGTCVGTLTATPPATITVPATDTDGAFPVSWTASSTTGVSYIVERSDNGGAFAPVYSGSALTYATSGLGNGSYVFRVKATKSSYVESTYTTAAACVVTPTAVDAPVALTVPATDTDGAFPVSWPASALTGVTYKLERADNGGAFAPVYSGTALSYAVSGLGNGSYVFRVKATKSGYLDSVYTTSGSCVVTSTAVEAPVAISVPATSTATSLTVNWGASPTSDVSYVLERSLNNGTFSPVYSGTALTATVSGMSNGSYVFRVKATKSGYVSSSYVTSGTCVGTLTATPPATLTVPATDTDGAFSVSWTASSTTSVTYKLERSDDGGATFNPTPVYSGTVLSYAASGLADGSYVFRVKAIKSSYVDSDYTTAGTCVVTLTAVDAPASISVPATDTDGAFTVSWPSSVLTGVTYKLERSSDGGSTFTQVYSGTALSYVVSGLADGSYVFRVKATKSGYLESVYTTAATACVVMLTAVDAPALISVPATSTSTSLTVSWEASPTSGVSYVLERSLNGGTFSQVYSGTALTASVSGMSNGSYVFRVKATKSGYVSSSYVTSGTCVGTLTAAPPATITVPATDTDGAFSVSWTASSTTSVTYKLERSDDGGATFNPTPVYSGTALGYAVSGLADGNYVFRVKATKSSYVDSTYTTSGTCTVAP